MGFHQDGYATVWSVEPNRTGRVTKVKLSTGKRDKQTNKFEQDFSGFVSFVGSANEGAKKLRERDRIKILSCDVTSRYDSTKKREFVNYTVFDFEKVEGGGTATTTAASPTRSRVAPIAQQADESDTATTEDDNLPF